MKVIDLFKVYNARSKAYEDHEAGDVAFVSNGFSNNGVVGFVKPLPQERVFNFMGICISAFCEATVQKPPFLPRGNGGSGLVVLESVKPMSFSELLYYATCINKGEAWKFSYGKMIRKDRAEEIQLIKFDPSVANVDISSILPKRTTIKKESPRITKWKNYQITDIFDIKRGDFHAIDALDPGETMTVSRVAVDNGIVGFYEPPQGTTVYHAGVITVSTVTGDAFVQLREFIATDNVVICTPKIPLKLTSLFFIQFMIDQVKWRYSYGRQCYKTKFAQTKIDLPVNDIGELDEITMEQIIKNTGYWSFLEDSIDSN